jgi:hypothetical protein
VREGAIRPAEQEVINLLTQTLQFQFDWRKKLLSNLEQLRAQVSRATAFGVNFDESFVARIILANLHAALQHDWGRDLREAEQRIRKRYTYSHQHTASSLAWIIAELTTADNARDPTDAASPTTHAAHAAHDASMSVLHQFMQQDFDKETALGAYSDSESSNDTKKTSKSTKSTKTSKSSKTTRARSSSRGRSTERATGKWQDNPCKHCKKFKRRYQHPEIDEKQCHWNSKKTGWRPAWICTEMGVPYSGRHNYDSDE